MDYTRLGVFGAIGAVAALIIAPEITLPVALGGALVGGGVDTVAQVSDSANTVTDNQGNSYSGFTFLPTTTVLDANGNPVTQYSATGFIVGGLAIVGVLYFVFRR